MMKINEVSQMLAPANFQCKVDNPVPGLPMSFMHVTFSKDAGPVIRMLATAMRESDNIATLLMAAVAEYHLDTGVDVLVLIAETIEEIKKVREAEKLNALFPHEKKN